MAVADSAALLRHTALVMKRGKESPLKTMEKKLTTKHPQKCIQIAGCGMQKIPHTPAKMA
eukprot:scaffold146_cov265-Pinguiococcus_pyrenoidosus.AAC.15